MLAGRLRGERLPDTGRTEEVDDEPLALAAHKVVERSAARVEFTVSFDEGTEKALSLFWENEAGEGFLVPVDVFDMADIELHCFTSSAREGVKKRSLLTP